MLVLSLFSRLRAIATEALTSNDLRCYNGPYAGGKARYHYYEDGGKRIYHGRMSFSLVYPDYPYGKGLKMAEGAFADGRKQGRWKFVSRKHDEASELSINYADGLADGKCVFKAEKRDPLDPLRGKSTLKMSLCNGKPIGAFKGQLSNCRMAGCCDDEGRPDGLWTLDFTAKGSCTVNYERWNHGVCVEAYELDNSTGKRSKPKTKIMEFLSNFIRQNCSPLTSIMPKGSAEWDGHFNSI